MNCATILVTDWVFSRKMNLSWSFIWAKPAAWIQADLSDLSWSYWEHFIRKWYSFSTCFKLSQRLDTKLWHFGWRQYRRSQLCIPFSQNKWETKSCIGDHRIIGNKGTEQRFICSKYIKFQTLLSRLKLVPVWLVNSMKAVFLFRVRFLKICYQADWLFVLSSSCNMLESCKFSESELWIMMEWVNTSIISRRESSFQEKK